VPSGKKPPSDPAKAAKSILDQVTGEKPAVEQPEKNLQAAQLGAAGGRRRAESLSPEKRKQIARTAARKRWHGDDDDIPRMDDTTKIALKNYDWLIRNRADVGLFWDTSTVAYGDGGAHIDLLCQPGFTAATREPADGVE
jgi:hypothetical protein